VNDVGIIWIDAAHEAIAATDAQPVFINGAGAAETDGRPHPRAVVLQSARDVVRLLGRDGDVVKLAEGHGVQMVPVRRAIVSRIPAAVGPDEHVPSVAWIDP